MTSTPVDTATFDLFDPAMQQDPHRWYDAFRNHGVTYLPKNDMWLVLRHDLVLDIIRDTATFSNRWGSNREPPPEEIRAEYDALMATALPHARTMLDNDPPDQSRMRMLVTRAFTPKVIATLRPTAEQACDQAIEAFIDRTDIEFMRDYAVPLPIAVITQALNMPADRSHDFKRWSDDNIAAIGAKLGPREYLDAQRGFVEMQAFFAAEFEKRRAKPGDDLLSEIANGVVEIGGETRPLTMSEMVRMSQMILVAGNETTTKSLTETMRLLAEHPDEWDAIKADPSRIPNVVEEGLRLSSPTQGSYRIATRNVVVDGVAIPAGAKLVVMFAAANRDEALYACPHIFDPSRANLKEQLAFGKGAHFCLGAALARMEAEVALQRFTTRVKRIRLADSNDFAYQPSFMLRGLKKLHLIIEPET
jgi:cytochrome P450